MAVKKVVTWYGLEMLAGYLALSQGKLEVAEKQLQAFQDRQYARSMGAGTLALIIKTYRQQNRATEKELADILQIERNTKQVEKTNKKLQRLSKQYKKRCLPAKPLS